MSRQYLQCGRFDFDLAKRPLVMGILNITPDSFSDGGRHHALEFAVEGAEQMIKDGVDIIDIGGESTRPGSPSVTVEEELRRVMPVIYALRELGVPLSIDTCKPDVMREAILAGADMINDINGFRAPGALEAVRRSDVGLCVMHMQGTPQDMQAQPVYGNVVAEVIGFLRTRVDALVAGGMVRERVTIDPGFGFGKTVEHNVALLRGISDMQREIGLPVLAGLSRKSMVGALTGKPISRCISEIPLSKATLCST
ncbi:MAG: dihydropteroate synthase, partial [Oxalobacteraceae bacterium]